MFTAVSTMQAAVPLTGPYMVKEIVSRTHVSTITKDFLRYLNSPEKTVPALEYISPIKGPNLPTITVKIGSGLLTAEQGALAYDRDVQKELVRLGLPAWGKLPG